MQDEEDKEPSLPSAEIETQPTLSADPTLASLQEENERLHTILDGRFDRETVLKYLNYTEGGPLTMGVSAPDFMRRFFAEMFIIAFDDAENFQTGSFEWKTESYELTIRRISGKAPAQVLFELRAQNAALTEALEKIRDTRCGIYGHSVAVNCGAQGIAADALALATKPVTREKRDNNQTQEESSAALT